VDVLTELIWRVLSEHGPTRVEGKRWNKSVYQLSFRPLTVSHVHTKRGVRAALSFVHTGLKKCPQPPHTKVTTFSTTACRASSAGLSSYAPPRTDRARRCD